MENQAASVLELEADIKKKTFALQSVIGQKKRHAELTSLISKSMTASNWRFFRDLMVAESNSQFLQDKFALAIAGTKEPGFFVEFGACDGLHLSNTLLLEKRFNWKGILAEPARVWSEALHQNRSALIETRCVSGETGRVVTFREADAPDQSSVIKTVDGQTEVATYDVDTVSLVDMLRQHNAPKTIDFMSIDCEGHERPVLETFDFNAYTFNFICVEQHPKVRVGGPQDVSGILENAGYVNILPRSDKPIWMNPTGFDLWYVAPHIAEKLFAN